MNHTAWSCKAVWKRIGGINSNHTGNKGKGAINTVPYDHVHTLQSGSNSVYKHHYSRQLVDQLVLLRLHKAQTNSVYIKALHANKWLKAEQKGGQSCAEDKAVM